MSVRTDKVNLNVSVGADRARKELADLQRQAKATAKEMRGLKDDSDKLAKKNELDKMTSRMADLKKQIGLTGLTQKQLNEEMNRMKLMDRNLVPFTKAWKDNRTEMDAVKRRMEEVRHGTTGLGLAWKKVGAEVKAFGVLAAGALGAQFLLQKVSNVIKSLYEMSDSLANVRKTTGMTEEQVKDLDKRLGELNTRTSRKELRDLATEAGKIGKSSVEDVARFVAEADKIKVALGEDLGKDAIIQIGKMADVYHAGMLQIGSAVNSIGQNSTAAEQYLVDFASRVGGTAATTKIAAADVLGFASVLDQAGLQAEMSATAFNTFMIDFVKNAEKFGPAAGMSGDALREMINSKGTNEAFITWLQNLKDSSKGSADFLRKLEEIGIDGARGAQVFLTLGNNIGKVKDQQALANKEFATGTSILNEFNTKNENMAAKIDKLLKMFNSWVANSALAKTFENVINSIYKMSGAMDEMEDPLKNVNREFNSQIEILKRGNFTSEERKRLIDEINTEFKDYLPRLITEKDTLEDISGIQSEVNKKMMQRILLNEYQKELTDMILRQKDAFDSMYEVEKKRAELSMTDPNANLSPGQIAQMQQQLNMIDATSQSMVTSSTAAIVELQKKIAAGSKLLGDTLKETMTNNDLGEVQQEISAKQIADDKKTNDAILDQHRVLRDMLITLMDDGYEKEKAKATVHFQDFLEDRKIDFFKWTSLTQEQQAIYKAAYEQYTNEVMALDKKREQGLLKGEYDTWTAVVRKVKSSIQEIIEWENRHLENEKRLTEAKYNLLDASLAFANTVAGIIRDNQKEGSKALHDAAVAQKVISTVQAIIAGVVAVQNTLASPIPFPGNVLAAAGVGIAAAANVATIIGTKIPAIGGYAEGGLADVNKGGAVGSKKLAYFGEEGPEYVVPNWMLQHPAVANIAGLLENIRVNGFASGGMAGGAAPVNNINIDNSEVVGEMRRIGRVVAKLESRLNKPIYSVLDYDYHKRSTEKLLRVRKRSGL